MHTSPDYDAKMQRCCHCSTAKWSRSQTWLSPQRSAAKATSVSSSSYKRLSAMPKISPCQQGARTAIIGGAPSMLWKGQAASTRPACFQQRTSSQRDQWRNGISKPLPLDDPSKLLRFSIFPILCCQCLSHLLLLLTWCWWVCVRAVPNQLADEIWRRWTEDRLRLTESLVWLRRSLSLPFVSHLPAEDWSYAWAA